MTMSDWLPPEWLFTASSRCSRCLALIVLVYGVVADPLTVIEHMRTLTAVLPMTSRS